MTGFRDTDSASPASHIVIPPGVWLVRVDNESRFNMVPVLIRGGRDREQINVGAISSATFQVQTEAAAEMYFRLSAEPNTNDQAVYRMGVTMTRLGGFTN